MPIGAQGTGTVAAAGSISVIIPARNAAGTITRGLRSLAPDRNLIREILLIDDASDDDTAGTAKLAALQHTLPLTVLEANVRNAGAARNIGLRHAGGDLIFFLDADDELFRGGLRRLFDVLKSDQNAQLAIGGNIRRTEGRTDKLKLPHSYTHSRNENARNYITNKMYPIAMGSALAVRDIAAAIRFPEDLQLEEDTCYWAAVLATANVVTVDKEVLYYNLDEAKMANRFVALPGREFTRIAAALNRLVAHGLDRQALNWRKSWVAMRMVRQLVLQHQYPSAQSLMRVVMAHPEFRSSIRVLRYSTRIRVGLLANRFRASRSAVSNTNEASEA